jgi:hypothetical protein
MNSWISIDRALDALDPITEMTPAQSARLAYFSEVESEARTSPGSLRRKIAGGLVRLAIMLDPRAQAALIEAGGHR